MKDDTYRTYKIYSGYDNTVIGRGSTGDWRSLAWVIRQKCEVSDALASEAAGNAWKKQGVPAVISNGRTVVVDKQMI